MKHIFGFLFACCLSLAATAQQYNMSTTSVSTCSGYFYDSGGAGNYPNNQNDTMTFTSANGNRLVFTFSSISLYGPYDRLEVYDGPSTAYPLIGTYYSNAVTITSTGASLTFVFISDNINTYPGWVASISCGGPVIPLYPLSSGTVTLCEGQFFDSGGMFGDYQDNEDREMTFTSANGEYLQFDFIPNYINISANDSLFIYDGASTSAPLYAILTGINSSPGSIVSSTTSLTFRFKSDGATHNMGWRAWITCVSATYAPHIAMTSGVRYVCGGSFFDPGDAGDYGNNEDRVQTFYSNSGCALQITFTMFDTEGMADILYVYDGPSTASPLLGWFSGGGIPPTLQSTGNALTFHFVSDATASFYSGWSANFSCVNQPTATITAGGPTTICNGDTVILNASPNTSYLWNTGATTQSLPVTSAGSYWVTVQNASSCAAISPMTIVNTGSPTAVVTAGGPTSFCQGDSVTLTASGGGTYLWSDSSTGSTLHVTQTGTYYVIADNGSCSDTSASIAVNVNPLPGVALTLPIDTFCTSVQSFTLSGGAPAGGVYSGPGVSGGQLDPLSAGTGMHTMTYTYTDANGCTNTATENFLVDICNGINTPSVEGVLRVTPNPTNDLLLITFTNGAAANQVQLMDVTGRVVLEQSTNGQAQLTISMKELPSGIYLLRTVGGTNETIRVVKE